MNKHINFEDNIFVLNIRIRMIQDLLILDADADIFLQKTFDDFDFINTALNSLLATLKENLRLIDRDEQFYNLLETERQFCDALNEMDHGEGPFSVISDSMRRTGLDGLLEASQERQKGIITLIAESRQLAAEPVVGYEELHELLGSA